MVKQPSFQRLGSNWKTENMDEMAEIIGSQVLSELDECAQLTKITCTFQIISVITQSCTFSTFSNS